MTDDHRFVDATGASHGREAMETGWEAYFSGFPDCRVEIEKTIAPGDKVALFGWASGTVSGPPGPAAWRIPADWRDVHVGRHRDDFLPGGLARRKQEPKDVRTPIIPATRRV